MSALFTALHRNEDMLLLLNKNLCKQRDPHSQNEFDFNEKHIH